MQALTGGVSSDIWRVDLPGQRVCVKRALAKLKVQADWQAPVGRNAAEVAWMQAVHSIAPTAVPKVLAHDSAAGLFVMEYLDPARCLLWKNELRAGRADSKFARAVGRVLARIHSQTAGSAQMMAGFANDATFYPIRLEPYLVATANRHPDRAAQLRALVETTLANKRALVHGDVSPKNILIGVDGPVLLDAECACYADPAFDLAFCLKHLLLKCLWTPHAMADFLSCYAALAESYLEGVTWEPRAEVEARGARLLPGLFLARVDGKSPVEYITAEADKDKVRRVARALLLDAPARLDEISAAWRRELTA